MFHGGGSEVFDDGEILVVPPPKSRNSPDFDIMMVGNHSYGPGYRPHGSQPIQNRGYVVGEQGTMDTIYCFFVNSCSKLLTKTFGLDHRESHCT